MKKYKKTYAILNLAEKHTVFHLGKTRVSVSFTGGIVTKKGVTPATFTTDDPIVQFAIENSADFKKGAITLQSKYPVQGEVRIGKNPPEEDKPASTATEPPAPETPKADLIKESAASVQAPAPAENPEPPAVENAENPEPPAKEDATESEMAAQEDAATEEKPKQEAAEKTGELEVIETSCKDTAKAYLQDHFGENPAPLRTREDVQNCAAKYGITFNFV